MPKIDSEAFRILMESVPDGFFVHDAAGRFLDVNSQSCADLGYSRDELLSMTINDISTGADPEANIRRWGETPAGASMRFIEQAVRKDGSGFPVEISLTCQMVEGQKRFFGVARDVSEREAAREEAERINAELERRVEARTAELKQVHERMLIAVRVGGIGIWDYDMVRGTLDCDEQWHRIMGRDPTAPVRTVEELRALIHPDDADRATEVEETVKRLAALGQDYGIVFRIFRPDGEMRWLRSAGHVVEDDAGRPVRAVGLVIDITETMLAEANLQRQTLEDPLTGLANRRRLDDELVKACLHATRTGTPVTLAMIDIDHFKLYNDELGHVRGDAALKAVAGLVQSIARRPYDLAVRYGGEEFLLLLPGVDDPEPILRQIADELEVLAIPHPSSPVAPVLTISCGVVVADELADVDPLDLVAACDRALYGAKAAGRNRIDVVRL